MLLETQTDDRKGLWIYSCSTYSNYTKILQPSFNLIGQHPWLMVFMIRKRYSMELKIVNVEKVDTRYKTI